MRALIEALIESGYTLVVCRDHLYTFKYGYITVLVNTYALTGNYAVIAINSRHGEIKPCRVKSISELNERIRNYKVADKADLKLYKAIKLNARKKSAQRELNLAV